MEGSFRSGTFKEILIGIFIARLDGLSLRLDPDTSQQLSSGNCGSMPTGLPHVVVFV
jgi:hypothetical protein